MKQPSMPLIIFIVFLFTSPVLVFQFLSAPESSTPPPPPVVDCQSADKALTECAFDFGKSIGQMRYKYTDYEWDMKYKTWCMEQFEQCEQYCGAGKC